MNAQDRKNALSHFPIDAGGRIERCVKCGGFLFALFLKTKFGDIVQEEIECPVCLRRELIALKEGRQDNIPGSR